MANREDEFYRQNYYGGHPPTCTCVKCTEKRLARAANTRSAESFWLVTLIGISICAAIWMVYLVIRGSIDTQTGMALTAVNLSVAIWAFSYHRNPWASFRSVIISLTIVIFALIITVALW
ncbi:MAG: hypothetical protein GX602_07055 [Dehalococcoidales bacterium]|jgi:hypothetical protein|nr:hypothetical protein [Dehalococcoidales bacterium]NLE90667.1 hypothetical protein [Dehalococcoidales bacterium]